MNINKKNISNNIVNIIKKKLTEYNIDAYIIPTADPHMSEYIPAYWKIREWVSGFTGSVGTLVITKQYVGLWTDGRYWEQAEKQLKNTEIKLEKVTSIDTSYGYWLAKNMSNNSIVAVDGNILSYDEKLFLNSKFEDKNIKLKTNLDLISSIWKDRPILPKNHIYEHNLQYCGKNRKDKINSIKAYLLKNKIDYLLISSLDDIAWVTNLRGSDIDYNPVFLSFLLVSKKKVLLFVDDDKIDTSLKIKLILDNIELKKYNKIDNYLSKIPKSSTIEIDGKKTSSALVNNFHKKIKIINKISPTTLSKSIKLDLEINHIRKAMEYDGIAMCEFFSWLEDELFKNHQLNELSIEKKLIECRKKQPTFVSESFAMIVGFNRNAALPHYRALEDDFANIDTDGLLLIDSGAQYLGGTTDITRVFPIGNITQEQKDDFTLVLKAHIALATAIVPEGILSPLIDAIPRLELWKYGIDYNHGTGHGVGYFLNVHEGPQVISYLRPANKDTKLYNGMITSNEPGLYRSGKWGIRIENLIVSLPYKPKEQNFGKYLYFETLTLCPIDTRLINKELLSFKEINWLNDYHQLIYERIADRLSDNAKEWLLNRIKPI